MSKPALTGITKSELTDSLAELGEPKYRAAQILQWVFEKRVTDFSQMTNLGQGLRQKLAETYTLRSSAPAHEANSDDTTQKYLYRLHDGRYVESVLIPANPALYGEKSDRHTICVSSQVGCAYDCKFCASGLAGFARNLTSAEIVEQILYTEQISGEKVNNLVFMGMGEPLANLTNLRTSIEIINAEWGVHIGARKITISTSGLAPQIKKLAEIPLQIRLAISLHGATDEVRDQIMPVNKKYPLAVLTEALEFYQERKKQKITFEYILIEGVNDALQQATELSKLARRLHTKVNLIPYNTVEGLQWKRPSEDQQEAFLSVLQNAGVTATLRREKGHDINAACGQLRLKKETAEGVITT
ncbi:MAG: 23S rRNA (adenine2503-C2)-methyltransferase [Verrucomicrobiales bacterium]|jgi:23S rRNA (adenine2503-C2)-methyltransferase